MTYDEAAAIINATGGWIRRARDAWQSGHTIACLTETHLVIRTRQATSAQALEYLTEDQLRQELGE